MDVAFSRSATCTRDSIDSRLVGALRTYQSFDTIVLSNDPTGTLEFGHVSYTPTARGLGMDSQDVVLTDCFGGKAFDVFLRFVEQFHHRLQTTKVSDVASDVLIVGDLFENV